MSREGSAGRGRRPFGSVDEGQRWSPSLKEQASVIVVTYNHRDEIGACIRSVLDEQPLEVIVVDNGSTDGTPEFVAEKFDDVTLIRTAENLGWGRGNQRGTEAASGEYLIFVNPDAEIRSGSLEALLKPLAGRESVITTPKILVKDRREINACGTINHFTGLAFTRGFGREPERYDETERVTGVSGACFALTVQTYETLDGFNEQLFLYMDDVAISWRANRQGIDVIHVPDSVVLHSYTLEVDPEKLYYLEKGRYVILREHLDTREWSLLLPSLLATEALTWGYAALNGVEGLSEKAAATIDGLTESIGPRRKSGRRVTPELDTEIPEEQLHDTELEAVAKSIANAVYRANMAVARRWLRRCEGDR